MLVAPLAKSARSTVYLARSTGEARLSAAPVVVKIHEPPLDDAALDRARRRATVLSAHSPRISEIGRGERHSFVVMEHVPGWTLARVLEASGERWPVASAARLASGVAQALGRLGTLADPDRVHGHVCPEKVLLGSEGRARLIGLDRPPGPPRLGFASPEQLADAPLDPRADLYGLAAILWRLLTGTPWIAPAPAAAMRAATLEAEPRSVRALAPEVPARLDALIQTTLSPDPASRFASADDFREALLALVPAAEGPEPDVSDLVGEALWSERESTRTILARAAESMMPFLRPGESFDGWGQPVVAPNVPVVALDATAANAARHTPVGAQRRFPATIIRRPDEPGTPRSDPGASEPIPYADTPSEPRVAQAPGESVVPKLRAPTFQGTWAAAYPGQRDSDRLARAGQPTQDLLLENAPVVDPDATGSAEVPAAEVTRPMAPQPTATLPIAPSPIAPSPLPATSAPRPAAPATRTRPPRFRWGPALLTLGAIAVVALSAFVIHHTTAQVADTPRETVAASPLPSPPPVVGAVAAPTATTTEVRPSPPAEATPAPQPESPRPSPRPARTPVASPSPSASASPSPVVAPAGEATMARISQLLARARRTRARLREPAPIAELDKVIGALVLEASAPEAVGVDERLRALETTLARLEAPP